MGSAEIRGGSGENEYILTATPNADYLFTNWTYTVRDDTTVYGIDGSITDNPLTATVTEDRTYTANFRMTKIDILDGFVTRETEIPDVPWYPTIIEDDGSATYTAASPGKAPAQQAPIVGEPASLYVTWWPDGKIASGKHNITLKVYEGDKAEGDPLFTSDALPLYHTRDDIGASYDKDSGYYFRLFFTMPNAEKLTLSVELEGRDPVVETFSTGLVASLQELQTKYDTLENLEWRYFIDQILDEAVSDITDAGNDEEAIKGIVTSAESEIHKYINGQKTDYIEVVFNDTMAYVPSGVVQSEALMAALEQAYPREKGFWYFEIYNGWVNGYGGRLFTASELGADGIAHTSDDGTLETEIKAPHKTYAVGESLPHSDELSASVQSGNLTYRVNGYFADLGITSWKVDEDEMFTWGPASSSGYDPIYTIPSTGGTDDEVKQLKWAAMVLQHEGVTLNDIYTALSASLNGVSDTSGMTAKAVHDALLEAYENESYGNRLTWNLPTSYTGNSYVTAAMTAINAIDGKTGDELTTAITAAREAYDAIPNTSFGSKIWREHYFREYEPYKTAYEKLLAAEVTAGITKPLPEITAEDALSNTLNYIKSTVTAPDFGTYSGEWSVLALARGGASVADSYYTDYYDRIVAEVQSIGSNKLDSDSTDNSRLVLALSALGIDATSVGGYDLVAALQDTSYVNNGQGTNAIAYALLALDSKPYNDTASEAARSALVQLLVNGAISGGGWSLDGTGSADVDITAMVLQALAPYYQTDTSVRTKVDEALTWLKTKQNAIGGFVAFGETSDDSANTYSTAQVVTALCALNIDPASWEVAGEWNPVMALLDNYVTGGGFGQTSATATEEMATDQGAYALVAYSRFVNNKNSLYNMSDAFVKSDDASVKSLSVGSVAATAGGSNTFTVSLPTGTTLTADSFEITLTDSKATAGTPTKTDDTTWKFTVTAEDGTAVEYTVNVTFSENTELAANIEAVNGAKTAVSGASYDTTQEKANTQGAIKTHVESVVNGLALNGVTATVEVTDFTAAVAGTSGNTAGTNGSFTAKITLSKGADTTLASSTVTITGTITATKYTASSDLPMPDNTINVTFRLVGAEQATQDVDLSSSDYMPEYVTWIATEGYTLEKGSTVYDLLIQALADAGLRQVGAEDNYVETIYAPSVLGGFALSEKDNGPKSGWMYTVNGSHPNIGLKNRTLSDGDRVVWHYVNDFSYEVQDWSGGTSKGDASIWNGWLKVADVNPTGDGIPGGTPGAGGETLTVPVSGAENTVHAEVTISEDGIVTVTALDEAELEQIIGSDVATGVVEIDLTGLNMDVSSVDLPSSTIEAIVEAAERANNDTEALAIHLTTGTVQLDDKTMRAIVDQAGGDTIRLVLDNAGTSRLSSAQKDAIKDMDVHGGIEAYFVCTHTNQRIGDFKGGVATMKIPFTIPSGYAASGFSVWYVDDEGGLEKQDTYYANGHLVCNVGHYSDFIIAYDEADVVVANCPKDATCPIHPFTDTDKTAWYHDGVHYCIENGLMNGTGDTTFAPQTTTSRAMIVTILHRLEGAPAPAGGNPFTDVADGQWYTNAVIWAAANGIVEGYGDDTFGPDDTITREQMATILWRYARYKGIDAGATADIQSFTDADTVSDWALDAVKWANGSGLITGTTGSSGVLLLDPQGSAVRAQAATILMRYCTQIAQ